ncbi:MAG TPA: HemK family protein methyltransferase [Candidatus Woesebacteria bacterium]|nr:HemK family protein methyltransferase [Candidatus Woesebacteria bacterium]
MSLKSRSWTAYEKNQLLSRGFSLSQLEQYGNKPVEYITHRADFYDREFVVDERVLIPRVESHGLVQLALSFLRFHTSIQPLNCFEVGTGSGCIGLSIFCELPDFLKKQLNLFMGDLDPACLEVSAINLRRLIPLLFQPKVKLLQSNLLSNFPHCAPNLIVANLPYVPTALLEVLDDSVKYFEPNLALDGGSDGLELIRKLIKQAITVLLPSGVLLLEIDERSSISRNSLELSDPNWLIAVFADEFQKQRYLVISQEQTCKKEWWRYLGDLNHCERPNVLRIL